MIPTSEASLCLRAPAPSKALAPNPPASSSTSVATVEPCKNARRERFLSHYEHRMASPADHLEQRWVAAGPRIAPIHPSKLAPPGVKHTRHPGCAARRLTLAVSALRLLTAEVSGAGA
jgi:hypothetical protein